MKASDYIAHFLVEKGITVVFGYIGGMITHLVDSLDKNPHIRFIQTYHEQTASIAAEGYAYESGKPGVAIATSGPGATNLMTGIADAYFGNIPVIFITGQVNTYEYKYDKPIRQQGFQETDVISIVKPITKYAVMVNDATHLKYELEKAYYIATTGRKGPVLIDLPMDVSRTDIEPDLMPSYRPDPENNSNIDWVSIKNTLEDAKYPLILVGGGCRDSRDKLKEFLNTLHIPYVISLMGKGLVDEENPLFCGMIGSYGNRCANIIISQCDVLLALGSRLDTRQTGAKIEGFIPNGKIIHVDIDCNELQNHRIQNKININSDVENFIQEFSKEHIHVNLLPYWVNWISKIKGKYSQEQEVRRFVENGAPYKFFEVFNKISDIKSVITTDIGQNQMWAAQSITLKGEQEFLTSGGLAPMGFSLPAAIGVAFASPEKTVYCFNGDGGFHMACQSLLLISQYHLNVKVIILNNMSLGMITQFQHLYFNDRMIGTTGSNGYLVPDIKFMARSYHLPYRTISSANISVTKLRKAFDLSSCIVDYQIEGLTTVSPKLEYNQPIYNTSPYLDAQELQDIILLK